VHSNDELSAASAADYVIAGTVWSSVSKRDGHPCLGVAGLSALVRASTIPVLAIGGIDVSRLAEVAAAGAAGAAAIGFFIGEVSDGGCGAVALADVVHDARRRFGTSDTTNIPADPTLNGS
jgi:thiamine monophosphate synthase